MIGSHRQRAPAPGRRWGRLTTAPVVPNDRVGSPRGTPAAASPDELLSGGDGSVTDAAADAERAHASPDDAGSDAEANRYAWRRLEDQIEWYEHKSVEDKQWFLRLKVVQIVNAAAIPVAAGTGASARVTASLGAAVVVLEGFQQLFQFERNWARYRATTESLKHEKFLCLSSAGPYADLTRPLAVLVERVEGLVSQEHSAWSATQADAGGRRKGYVMRRESEDRDPGTVFAGCRIEAEAGRGGMGVAYCATHLALDMAALKLLAPAGLRRWLSRPLPPGVAPGRPARQPQRGRHSPWISSRVPRPEWRR
jgi:hypothetical protein